MPLWRFLELVPLLLVAVASLETSADHPKQRYPPPPEHLTVHPACINLWHVVNDSTYNCHGAKFHPTNGYFLPCNRHGHCYDAREPTDWCILPADFRWVHAGCHCDKKLSSCVIERFNMKTAELQWGYCTPIKEFYCASHVYYPN